MPIDCSLYAPGYSCLCTKNLGNYKSFRETYIARIVVKLITISFITLWFYKCYFTYDLINTRTIHTCLQPLWTYVASSFQCSLSRAKRPSIYMNYTLLQECHFASFFLFSFFLFFFARYGVYLHFSWLFRGLCLNYIIVFAVNRYAYFPVYSLPTEFIYRSKID